MTYAASFALVTMMTTATVLAQSTVHDVAVEFDLPFLGPDREERLDLYRPVPTRADERFPGIVIIHGGGWAGGTKSAGREINIGTNLARMGYVCISIDYVLSRSDRPSWPENIYDCKRAVQYLRVNAETWQLDPDHIGCIGGSAGGHLSAFLATAGPDAGLEPESPYPGVSSRVQAGVDLYGIADLQHWRKTKADGTPIDVFKHSSSERMLGASFGEDPELWYKASPYHQADAGDPPIFILHGKADTTVDYQQSIDFAARLSELGVENELMLLENIGHTFDLQRWGSRILDDSVRRRIMSFYDRHLRGATVLEAEARYERLLAWEAVSPEAAYAGAWSFTNAPVKSTDPDAEHITVERQGFPLTVRLIPATHIVLQTQASMADLPDRVNAVVSGRKTGENAFEADQLTTYAESTPIRSTVQNDLIRGRLTRQGDGTWTMQARGQEIALTLSETPSVALRRDAEASALQEGQTIVYARCRRIGEIIVADRLVTTADVPGEGD